MVDCRGLCVYASRRKIVKFKDRRYWKMRVVEIHDDREEKELLLLVHVGCKGNQTKTN